MVKGVQVLVIAIVVHVKVISRINIFLKKTILTRARDAYYASQARFVVTAQPNAPRPLNSTNRT